MKLAFFLFLMTILSGTDVLGGMWEDVEGGKYSYSANTKVQLYSGYESIFENLISKHFVNPC